MASPAGPAPDYLEAGAGERVILIHSSVAGARQWRSLMDRLAPRFHAIAINLYGYGGTEPWKMARKQTLSDQVDLVAAMMPDDGSKVSIVGHSFGGAVAMKAAARFSGRIRRLVLIEPNPFHLIVQRGRAEALGEALLLREAIKTHGGSGDWRRAAEVFANYWTGAGSWDAMPEDRRSKFAEALKPNFHEWDAVMSEETPLADWARALPRDTSVISADDTVASILAIVSLLQEAAPHWTFHRIGAGGHMAALTMAGEINPIVEKALG
ncbi:MAG: alpha/beta fold hydrolase [Paracoccaceae bacterium]|nr:alpha/beta fold hydrolase [Paracoccaceae bacterium]